jgi:hypothetical protein
VQADRDWAQPGEPDARGSGPPPWLTGNRHRVETMIGELTGRYQLKRVWGRNGWHLWSRWQHKLLSHT